MQDTNNFSFTKIHETFQTRSSQSEEVWPSPREAPLWEGKRLVAGLRALCSMQTKSGQWCTCERPLGSTTADKSVLCCENVY